MADIQVDGLSRTLRRFRNMPGEVSENVTDAIKSNAEKIEDDQKNLVLTSRDRETYNAISIEYEDDGLTADIRPRGSGGFKRHWIEFGTASRVTKDGGSRGAMPANPFIIPSYENNVDGYVKDLNDILGNLK